MVGGPMLKGTAGPAAPRERLFWRRKRVVAIALAAVLCGAGWVAWRGAAGLRGRVEQRYARWRVERFLAQAAEAARAERPQVAIAALESAAELAPGNWSIRLARSDQLQLAGRSGEAWRLWEEWLGGPVEQRPAPLVLGFAGRLIAAGEFGRLSRLAIMELGRPGPLSGTWLNLAAESAVLAGTTFVPGIPEAPGDPAIRGVLTGYHRARLGDHAAAVAALTGAGGAAMPGPLAVLAARAWLVLGDSPRARIALARTTGPVVPREAFIQEALFLERGSAEEGLLLRGVLPEGLEAPERALRATLFMLFTLDGPAASAAEALSARFLPVEASLDTPFAATLWLYCARARSEREEREWRARLQVRLRSPPPPVAAGPFTVPLLRLTIDRVPLPLEIVCALMARTRPGGP